MNIAKLVVGLGTSVAPGTANRHSVGAECLRAYAVQRQLTWVIHNEVPALIAEAPSNIAFVRPLGHINQSGVAVRAFAERHNVSAADILVIHDDLDLPVGKLKVRRSGSSGGHNGVKSVIEQLAQEDFPRLKIGVGRPTNGVGAREYLLEEQSSREHDSQFASVYDRAAEVIDHWLCAGTDSTMNQFNSKGE